MEIEGNFRSLCTKIIKFISNNKFSNTCSDKEVQNELDSIMFPNFSLDQVEIIEKALEGSESVTDILFSNGFIFPFRPDLIELVTKSQWLSDNNQQLQFSIIYYSFVSWIQLFLQNNSSEFSKTLLNSFFCQPPNSECTEISIISFYNVFLYTFKCGFSKIEEIEEYAEILLSFIRIKNNDSLMIYKLLPLILRSIKNNNMDNQRYGYTFISKVLDMKENGINIPDNIIVELFVTSEEKIRNIDLEVMNMLSRAANMVSLDLMVPFVSMIMSSIITAISKIDEFISTSEPDIELIELPENHKYEIIPDVVNHETFPEELEIIKGVSFPEFKSFYEILPKSLIAFVLPLINIAQKNKKARDMIEKESKDIFSIVEGNETIWMHCCALIMFIYTEVSKKCEIILPVDVITHTYIFQPLVTVFREGDEFSSINLMRKVAIKMIVKSGPEAMKVLLESIMRYPLIEAEVIYRIAEVADSIDINEGTVLLYSRLIISLMFYYQSFGNLNEEDLSYINNVRMSIFYLISVLFKDIKKFKMLMNEPNFSATFLILIYEDPVRNFVLTNIKKVLELDDCKYLKIFNNDLAQRTIDIFQNLNYEGIFDIALELIMTIKDYEFCINIYEEMCRSLLLLPKGDDSETFILEALDVLITCAKQVVINTPELAALEAAILHVFGEPTQDLFIKLVQLLAGQNLITPQPIFIVRQSKVYRLIIGVFKDTQLLSFTFKFIAQLCEFSPINCAAAATGGLSNIIIEMLSTWITDQKANIQLIASAMSLLMIISTTASSVQVARSFISLLCPIEGRTIPHTQQLTLKVLNNMLVDSLKKPRNALPLKPSGAFSTIIDVPSTFTIAFWYFSPSLDDESYPNIVDIGLLKIFFKGDLLFIGNDEIRLNLVQKLWNFISITVDTKDKSVFKVRINDEEEFIINSDKIYKFGEKIPISIGGSNRSDVQCLLGSFGIFNTLTNEELSEIMKVSMRGKMQGKKCILYMQPYESEGFVNIESNHTVTKSKVQCSPFVSFGDVLVDKCGIEMLLPLFAQWDLPMQNGAPNNISESIMVILTNAFKISVEAQNQFNAAGGFQILAHLLVSANSKHITYSLYQKFYALLAIIGETKTRESLISNILLNLNLWFKCSASDHLYIVAHWARVLVKQNFESVKKILSFESILSTLIIYYWYSGSYAETLIVKDRVRGEKLNVAECRKFIFEILLAFAKNSFTDNDLKLLMSSILTCEDTLQSLDFLDFLQKILMTKSIIEKCHNVGQYIELLVFLFNMKSEEVVVAALSVIVTAHKYNLMGNLSVKSNVEIIMHTIGSYFSRTALVDRFLEFTDKVPEIFPLVTMMTLNNGRPGIFIDKTSPSKRLVSSDSWAIWVMIAIFRTDEETKKIIINFLLKCGTEALSKLIATAGTVGLILGKNSHDIKKQILMEAANYQELQTEFIDQCQHFLLFQENSDQLLIRNMYKDSVFFEDDGEEKPKEEIPKEEPKVEENAEKTSDDVPTKKKVTHAARHSLTVTAIRSIENQNAYTPEAAENALSILFPVQETKKSRRVSMLSISGTRRKSKLVSPKKIKTVMMPTELDNRIMHFSDHEFVYSFGIVFNESNKWEDEDLAKIYIEKIIEKKIPITKYAETIAGILVRSCNYDTKGFFDNSVFVKKCKSFRDNSKLDNSTVLGAFDFLEDMSTSYDTKTTEASLNIMRYIIKSNESNAEISAKSLSIASILASLSANCLADFSDRISQSKSHSSHLWSHLWQCMCVNHAPWSRSLPAGHAAPHYKRDMSMTGFIPLKLKKNHSFNDHLHDSLVRDTGDEGAAQKKLEHYKHVLAAEYAIHAPSALLDVVEDHSTTKKDIDIGTKGCIAEIPCELISITRKREGVFAILTDSIVINLEEKVKVIELNNIRDIYLRTNLHHPTAIEIFLTNGKSYLINFPKIASITVLKHLKKLPMPNLRDLQTTGFKQYFELHKFTEAWSTRQISNFDYLMLLNKFSGRTFNDASQYPFMPWILSDYTSLCIDLSDSKVYRDFTKPIGAINKERLDELIEKMDSFKEMGMDPYLYSSGMVSPLAVYLWLLRVEPFTTLHTEIQSGRFDHPARLFSSIPNAWLLSTTTQNDFRELIPEFFSFPEFLINANGFDLGTYAGKKVDDVILPNWASNPYEFVYMHRKALESDYVSAHINQWIDLVWGYKQTGKEALAANNLFMKEMYPNIWTDENLSNPEVRAGIEAILCHVGQVPQQLFTTPHIQRYAHIPSISSLSRPVSIELCTKDIVAGNIKQVAASKYSITVLDTVGELTVNTYDVSSINRLSRTAAAKPRSKSSSQKVISIGASPHAKKNERRSAVDNVIMDPLEIQASTEFNHKSKFVKDFCSSCMPQEQIVQTFLEGDSILISGRLSNELYKVGFTNGTIEKVIQERSRIVCASSDGSIACIANSEAVLSFYSISDFTTPLFIIPSFTSAVRCIAVSDEFHMVACGTRDSTIILVSLTNEQVTRVVELDGCRPVSCIITPKWGFICVYATKISCGSLEHVLILLSPNGDIINRREIDKGVSAWSAATTESGFDFILLVDETGNFFVFEAFYLDLGRRVFATTQKIVSVSMICEDSIAIAITDNGKVIFSPLQID